MFRCHKAEIMEERTASATSASELLAVAAGAPGAR
jgi:hypothetical protein